jgi:hypothetical protein
MKRAKLRITILKEIGTKADHSHSSKVQEGSRELVQNSLYAKINRNISYCSSITLRDVWKMVLICLWACDITIHSKPEFYLKQHQEASVDLFPVP